MAGLKPDLWNVFVGIDSYYKELFGGLDLNQFSSSIFVVNNFIYIVFQLGMTPLKFSISCERNNGFDVLHTLHYANYSTSRHAVAACYSKCLFITDAKPNGTAGPEKLQTDNVFEVPCPLNIHHYFKLLELFLNY